MGRPIDENIQQLLDAEACNTQSTLELRMTDGTVIRSATREIVAGGEIYSDDLRRIGEIVQSAFSNVDRTNSQTQNADKQIGLKILNGGIDKAEAIVGRYYEDKSDKSKNGWVELFRGEGKPTEVNPTDAAIEIVDDLVAAGYCVADWSYEPACPFRFKDSNCGYTGDAPPCAKNLATCRILHRFGGMESKEDVVSSSTPETIGGGIGSGGGGSTSGGGTCFVGATPILMGDGSLLPIRLVAVDDWVMSFDARGNPAPRRVLQTFRHYVNEANFLEMSDGSVLMVTREHQMFAPGGEFVAVGALRQTDSIMRHDGQSWRQITILKKTRREFETPVEVFNFEVDGLHVYFANGYGAHNSKAIEQQLETGVY